MSSSELMQDVLIDVYYFDTESGGAGSNRIRLSTLFSWFEENPRRLVRKIVAIGG